MTVLKKAINIYMKKLYFLFFIILISSQIFSQTGLTYSVDVEYYRFSSGCNYTNVPAQTTKTCDVNTTNWALRNGITAIIGDFSVFGYSFF